MSFWRIVFGLKERSAQELIARMIRKSKRRHEVNEILYEIISEDLLVEIACSKRNELYNKKQEHGLIDFVVREAAKKVTNQDLLKRIAETAEIDDAAKVAIHKITDRDFLRTIIDKREYAYGLYGRKKEASERLDYFHRLEEEERERIRRMEIARAHAAASTFDHNSLDSIVRVLKNEMVDLKYRVSAAEALGRLGDVGGVAPLLNILKKLKKLQNQSNESVFGKALILALARIGDPQACAPILKAMLTNLFPRGAGYGMSGKRYIVDRYPWREHLESLQRIFGDYAEIIADIIGYREIIIETKVTETYWKDMERYGQASDNDIIFEGSRTISYDEQAYKALKNLVEIKTQIATNLLYEIFIVMPAPRNQWLCPIITQYVSQRESHQYYLEAYLRKDAWKLLHGNLQNEKNRDGFR